MDPSIAGFFVVIISLTVYFLPSLIATERGHHNIAAIFALNLLLGWTILGWIGAVIWSLTSLPPAATPTAIDTQPPQPLSSMLI